uniref:Dilute domain-containing protein n=1 Tax=Mesocestoides corti TaxID=53468 RepID=A0A5K3FLR9_MESCO
MTVSPYFLDARQLIAISQSRMDSTGIHDFSPKVGMLRCLEGQEAPLIHRLVKGNPYFFFQNLGFFKDLDVSKTTSWPPLVVAELIFLLARGADAVHDEEQISAILSATIKTVQAELKKHPTNTELTLFWLANIFGLRNCIQEFGGGQGSQETVAEEEEVYYLENYDVSLFRPLLTDLLTLTFHRLMANIRETVFPPSVITGALLEYEPIPNLSCQALTASRSGGLQPQNTWLRRLPHFQRFTKNLDRVFEFVTAQAADTYLVWHVFYQIFYYITASALNTILLRKDLCNWARGAQIRHNLATLETWLSERDLIPDGPNQESNGAPGEGRQLREILSSLIQVCLILQSKKGASDKTTIESVCQLCPNLTISQVTRLLSRCTMVDGVEEQAQPEFLHAVRRRLRELRPEASCKTLCCGIEVSQSTLLLDSNNIDSLGEIPFRPLPNSLASFKIPTELDDLSQFIVTIET